MFASQKFISLFKFFWNGGSERGRNVKRNAIGALGIKLFAMVLQLVQVPIVLSYLTKDSYGVYLTITSIVMWAHNFDFGLGNGLRYKLTEALSVNNIIRSKELVSTAYVSLSLIMSAVGIIGIPIMFFLNWNSILNCYEYSNSYLAICVVATLSTFLVQFVLDLITIVLQAQQKTAISTAFRPIANSIAVIGVVLLSIFSHNSLLAACLMLTAPLVIVLLTANLLLFKSRFSNISPNISFFRRSQLKDIYSLGSKFFISSLSGLIIFQSSNILISNLISPIEVSVYSTAYTYFALIIVFHGIILTPFWPAITNAYVNGELQWLKGCMNKLAKVTFLFSLGAVVLLLVSKYAFHFWIGNRLTIPYILCMALCVFAIGNVWSAMYNCFIVGVGKAQVTMYLSLVKIIVYLPISIWLVKMYGTCGLVAALILVNTFPNIIMAYIQYKKIVNKTATGIWDK